VKQPLSNYCWAALSPRFEYENREKREKKAGKVEIYLLFEDAFSLNCRINYEVHNRTNDCRESRPGYFPGGGRYSLILAI